MGEVRELLPDPVRMVEGLRDTGYQFNTAVADIIDNSIAADASFVNVQLKMDLKGNISLMIYDDGIGMNKEGLIDAMRYGSKMRPSPNSLGKFGLGLKTASTAFCRKLSVISHDNADNQLYMATWDLDHVKKHGKWELLVDEPSADRKQLFESIIGNHSGTLVIWDNVDRLFKNIDNLGTTQAKKALQKLERDLRFHLAMVYQRFLNTSDNRARNVRITLNDAAIPHWDPFCVGESQLVSEDSPQVELSDGSLSVFNMKAYILPRKEEFSTEDAAKNANITNANQGIYIYRENRLIHGPDWLKMFSKEPHLSLLRVEFSFDHKLDEAFQVDIKKSQIILNEALYDHVLDFLNPPRRAAEEVYRKGTKAKTSAASKTAHDSSNRNISTKEGEINKPHVESVNQGSNEAQIVNRQGPIKLKLKIANSLKPAEVHVQAVVGIDDGLLWEPCLIDGHCGVRINTGHPYYHKVYLPNISEGVTVQGMDALLWAISVAELNYISESNKSIFGELRYEISRNLRKLVEDLPDPSIDE